MDRGFRSLFPAALLIVAAMEAAGQQVPDSLGIQNDAMADTIAPAALPGIDNQVFYYGKDSTIIDLDSQAIYLYGMDSYVRYGEMEVKAARIRFSFRDYTAFAKGIPDSTGALVGRAVFTDGDATFDEDSLAYNFKTKRGISYGVMTQEGDVYLHSRVSKKQDNGWIHIRHGMITTCDHPNPHFAFRLSKAIVIPDEKVVSGPLWLKIGKVPTPVALPFGFFPNKKESTHGILLPGYGFGQSKGYFLQNLGYYIPFQPHLETKMLFDIYSRGSWSVRNVTNYKKRYRYSGGFNISRTVNKEGFEELPSYFRQTTFNVQWNHQQDPKARPNSRFNANVNLGSSQNFRNNLNSSQQDFLTSTFNSAIQWSRSFSGKPYSVAVSANHTQNTRTRQVQVTLPSATFNVSRINLLKALMPRSPIGVQGAINLENYLSEQEQNIRFDNLGALTRKLNNGITANAGASTSWKMGPFVTINPSFSANGYLAFRQVAPVFDQDLGYSRLDTLSGVAFAGTWQAGVTANTRLYGMYTLLRGNGLKAVRHQVQPSFGVNYTPYQDFREYGYFGPDGTFLGYSPFDAARFRPANTREAANLRFGLNQNIEAKFRDKKSAKVAYKKVKLIEGWNTTASYNMLADSLNWSNLSVSAFTTIANNISLNYSSTYSLYARDSEGNEVQRYVWEDGNFLRMEGTNLAMRFKFRGKGRSKEKDEESSEEQASSGSGLNQTQQNMLDQNQASFVDMSVPWSFDFGYNLRLTRNWDDLLMRDETEVTQAVTLTGDITFFETLAFSVNTGYDITKEEFTTTNLSLHWNIHCWEFTANVVPFGLRKSYFVQLNIRSPLLKDLKIQRRGNLGDDTLLY